MIWRSPGEFRALTMTEVAGRPWFMSFWRIQLQWTLVPLVLFFGIFDLRFPLMPWLMASIWLFSVLFRALVVLKNLILRHWSCAGAYLIPAVSGAIGISLFWAYPLVTADLGDEAYVALMRPFYLYKISRLPADLAPKTMVFDIRGLFNTEVLAIYDEADEIAQLLLAAAWQRLLCSPSEACLYVKAMLPGGHFLYY